MERRFVVPSEASQTGLLATSPLAAVIVIRPVDLLANPVSVTDVGVTPKVGPSTSQVPLTVIEGAVRIVTGNCRPKSARVVDFVNPDANQR
jgi:hypothetical protein